MKQKPSGELKRELGIFDVAVNVINITIGSGIFLLPAFIAAILGNASIVAYFVCGSMFLLVALCYAEVAGRIPATGGAYAYVEKAFGPYFGFLANALFWLGYGTLGMAALINIAADILSVPFPVFGLVIYKAILFLLILGGCAYINIRGIKQSMLVVKVLTFIKLAPLVLLVVFGLFAIKKGNIGWPSLPSPEKLGEASLILFFSLTGGETALIISGEMKNPRRTGPLGLLIGIVSIILFYCLIHIVAQGVLGAELTHNLKAPLAAVARTIAGSWGFTVLIGCAVISIIGTLNSSVLVFPRVLFAGANDKLLPGFLSRVHPRYATPHLAIISFCAVIFTLAISGSFKQLAILSITSMLLLFLGVALAAIKFRLKPPPDGKSAFTLPGGLTIPILTVGMLLWFLFQSKSNEILGTAIFIALLSVIYLLKKLTAGSKPPTN